MTNDDKPIRIVRTPHNRDHFVMARATAQDTEISYEALGLLTYLLSKPDSWEVNIKDISKRSSKYQTYKILRELRQAGYMSLTKEKGGRYGKWVYEIFEAKQPTQLIESQQVENQDVENQHTQIVQKKSKIVQKRDNAPKSATPKKLLALPDNHAKWTWKHIEQYATQHPSLDILAACYGSMVKAAHTLPVKFIALDCIELFDELERNHIAPDQYIRLRSMAEMNGGTAKYNIFRRMVYALPDFLKTGQAPAESVGAKQQQEHMRVARLMNMELHPEMYTNEHT